MLRIHTFKLEQLKLEAYRGPAPYPCSYLLTHPSRNGPRDACTA
jgi:hypothetical protein